MHLPPHVSVSNIFEISRYRYKRNTLLIKLLKAFRQPTTGSAFLELIRYTKSPSFRQPYVLLEPKLHEIREIHSFAYQFGFDVRLTWNSAESPVYEVSRNSKTAPIR
ncbi:hypothetical protein CSKR_112088 [Clonorchis sinensis]|uniref:Uncharacterized protein n=1 Tax=Clonorchis sinensis TaxID=79923 RepID=A0A3R7CJF0_CLOSI|nr:hypothetical protein CSKR_112088 [Clonorchis sinensis]